jgi:hypothetical protein
MQNRTPYTEPNHKAQKNKAKIKDQKQSISRDEGPFLIIIS